MVFNSASIARKGLEQYNGFAFQLNSYSKNNPECAWQQYIIAFLAEAPEWYRTAGDLQLTAMINNWTDAAFPGNQILNTSVGLGPMPGNVIPKGTKLTISLQNDPATNNITGATYIVNAAAPTTIQIGSSIPKAPIVSFELDIVGPIDSENAVLTSGAGRIVYTAQSALTAHTGLPQCAEFRSWTAERANSFYSVLPSSPSNTFAQSFKIGSEPT
jgi:hypothetical protein